MSLAAFSTLVKNGATTFLIKAERITPATTPATKNNTSLSTIFFDLCKDKAFTRYKPNLF